MKDKHIEKINKFFIFGFLIYYQFYQFVFSYLFITKIVIKKLEFHKYIYLCIGSLLPTKKLELPSIIPLKIYQTWTTLELPPKMKENVELLKRQNPEFEYYLFDDKMCREFIKNNFSTDSGILWAFDKLRPGAYKADLWRYCVLFINGGIYLDIKYSCVKNFKLINLTDKEYFVRDRICNDNNGIYQAFIVSLPNNPILMSCINDIVDKCKHNNYDSDEIYNFLDLTGPGLVGHYFKTSTINNLDLYFNGDYIFNKYNPILKQYNHYREEQYNISFNNELYYKNMFKKRSVFNYPILKSKKSYNFSKLISKTILGKDIILNSGTLSIIEIDNNSYLVNQRWINYSYNEDGSKKNIPSQWVSLNSRFILDSNFEIKGDTVFLEEDFAKESHFLELGLEDIRLSKHNNDYYYIASYFDDKRKTTSMSSGKYETLSKSYLLERNIILPTFYNLNKCKLQEKNWTFVNYKNKLCIVYKWFPLQIGKINYESNTMNIIETKYNIPRYFKDARGSTPGYKFDDEIWFVIHKMQTSEENECYNYQDFFAVFDLDMNIIRYSELFKLDDCRIQICNGLIVKQNTIILSYSLMNTKSMISIYDIDTINKLKWFSN